MLCTFAATECGRVSGYNEYCYFLPLLPTHKMGVPLMNLMPVCSQCGWCSVGESITLWCGPGQPGVKVQHRSTICTGWISTVSSITYCSYCTCVFDYPLPTHPPPHSYAVYLVLLRRVVTDHDSLDIPMFFGRWWYYVNYINNALPQKYSVCAVPSLF